MEQFDGGVQALQQEKGVYFPTSVSSTLVATSSPCELHRAHSPKYTYCEVHHIIPRAFQGAWQPKGAVLDKDGLFDARTITLCRTSHGNVHFHLVNISRTRASAGSSVDEAATKWHATARRLGVPWSDAEVSVAKSALNRWVEWGGDLDFLIAQKLYGEI